MKAIAVLITAVGFGIAGNAFAATTQLPMDLVEWSKQGVGSISVVPEGIKISSETYTRQTTAMVSQTRVNFVGQEAFIKWKPDGNGGYACYTLGLRDDVDYLVDFQASVGNAYSGCRNTLLSDNTNYYTRFYINPDGSYEVTTSLGSYDTDGGTKIADQSGALSGGDALDRLKNAFVSIHHGDNHNPYASTVVTEVGFTRASRACEVRTDYDPAGCSGTTQVFSLADYDAYVANDFGRNGGSNYQSVKIGADLTDDTLDIESPCTITLAPGVALSGDFVSLDGRDGVLDDNGYVIDAGTACVLSETDNAGLGAGSVVNATTLTIQAAKTAKIGLNSTVNVQDGLAVVSTGDFSSSTAIIKAGSTVNAGSITMEASRGVHLGQNTIVTATGEISLTSTGETSASDAGVKSGASVAAGTLAIFASRQAKIGQNTTVNVSGDIDLESTGNASGSLAIVKAGAVVSTDRNMDLTSGNKATIGENTTVGVLGNLHMDAADSSKCTIKASATLTAGTKSGNCL